MNKETFTAGVKDTLEISVEMSDLDGTTQTVTASIQHGIQSWTFNLSDEDGDGIWQGSVDFVPEDTGRPSLKVYATDGEGDSAYVDVISRSFVVEEGEGDSRGMILIASIGGFIALLAAIAFLMNKRKQKQEELDMIDSWGAFGDGPKEVPQLEGGVSDSAGEVEAAQKAADMAAGEPQNAQPAQAAQEGGSTGGQSLDWDNI